jgi:hypothetical protein
MTTIFIQLCDTRLYMKLFLLSDGEITLRKILMNLFNEKKKKQIQIIECLLFINCWNEKKNRDLLLIST